MFTNNHLRAQLGYRQREFEIEVQTVIVFDYGFLLREVIMRGSDSLGDKIYLSKDSLHELYQYTMIHDIEVRIENKAL